MECPAWEKNGWNSGPWEMDVMEGRGSTMVEWREAYLNEKKNLLIVVFVSSRPLLSLYDCERKEKLSLNGFHHGVPWWDPFCDDFFFCFCFHSLVAKEGAGSKIGLSKVRQACKCTVFTVHSTCAPTYLTESKSRIFARLKYLDSLIFTAIKHEKKVGPRILPFGLAIIMYIVSSNHSLSW